jgi:hypothetical protein
MSAETGSTSNKVISKVNDRSQGITIAQAVARVSLAASIATLIFLVALHFLSPEFNPAWRMVSEYALGNYGWVLSLMFVAWGLSSWVLAFTIWSQVKTTAGKIGLIFLILAGLGEIMASIFDIRQPLHSAAGLIGIPSLPIAAMLISISLSHTEEWFAAKKALLWTANLTWISVLLLIGAFILMIVTYTQSGASVDPNAAIKALPEGVIGLVGWANRFLVVVYCVWTMTVAWLAGKMP